MRILDAIGSAVLAAVVMSGSATIALLQQVDAFDEVKGPAWAVIIIGGITTAAKDLQSRFSTPPGESRSQ